MKNPAYNPGAARFPDGWTMKRGRLDANGTDVHG